MIALIVIAVLVALLLVWFMAIYNRFVRLRNLVKEGWSGIEVQLKRRANIIPNLIETVKGYMGHERGLLERVTELRSKSMSSKKPLRLPKNIMISAICWTRKTRTSMRLS